MDNILLKLLGPCFLWLGACIVVAFSIMGIWIGYLSNRKEAIIPGVVGVFAGTLIGCYAFSLFIKIIFD